MLVTLQLALYLGVAVAVLGYLGYAPARALVRQPAARLLLMPALGLCVLAVGASYLTYLLPMPWAVTVLVGAATAANLAALRRTGHGLARPGRAEAMVLLAAVGAYAVASLPQVHAGTLAFLGVQWDLEIYLPLSDYLKRWAMGGELAAPANPLLGMMNDPAVRGGSGLGFMYFDAAMGSVLGWESWQTYRPSLFLAFALSVPSAFALCRWGFAMGPGASVKAAVLTAANGLNLWVASIGLGGHAVALALLPLCMLAALWVLRFQDVASAALAGLLVAGVLLTFYTGAAALLGATVVPLGLWGLAVARGGRTRVLAATAVAAGVAVALGAVGHARFLALVPLYAQNGLSEGWKVAEFLTLSQALGLAPYVLVQQRLGNALYLPVPPEAVVVWTTALSATAVGLCLLAVAWGGWLRWHWLAAVLGLAAFGAWLRWGAPYPYGYFKVLSLGSFLLAAGMAQGLALLATGVRSPLVAAPVARLCRAAAACVAFAAVPLLVANVAQSLRYYWEPDPAELPRETWELRALREVLAPGEPVYVTGRSGFDPRFAAMVAYFLMDNPVVGNLRSAYGAVRSERPDQDFAYLLLQRGERPEEAGLTDADLVWANRLVALYRRPEGWVGSVDLESVERPVPLSTLPVDLGLSHDRWSLANGHPLFSGTLDRAVQQQQLELTLLALEPATAVMTTGSQRQPLDLPAGLVRYRSAPVATPTTVSLALAGGDASVQLLGFRVLEAGSGSADLRVASDLLALEPRAAVAGQRASLEVPFFVTNQHGGYTAVAVEFYRRASAGLEPAGFVEVARAKGPGSLRARWEGDLADARCSDDAGPRSPRPDGDYEAHLAVYHVAEEVYRLRWLRFSVVGGRAAGVRQEALPPYVVHYLGLPRQAQALARMLPDGAAVYVPVARDPDHSLIAASVAALPPHRVVRDLAGAALPRYALLPTHVDPSDVGLEGVARLWEGQGAALYALPEALAAHLVWPGGIAVEPGGDLAVGIAAGSVRVSGDSGTWEQPAALAGPGQLVLRGVAPAPVELRLEGAVHDLVALRPGGFTYRSPPLTGPGSITMSVRSPGDAAVLLRSLSLAAGDGAERLVQTDEALVGATASQQRGVFRVDVRYVGPVAQGALIGLDVYEVAGCAPLHYGWWAAPVEAVGRAPAFELDAAHQQARLVDRPGVPLASQTWPLRDGTYRAFVMLKQGEQFDTLPVFEFTLQGGEVVAYEPYGGTRTVRVRW